MTKPSAKIVIADAQKVNAKPKRFVIDSIIQSIYTQLLLRGQRNLKGCLNLIDIIQQIADALEKVCN